MALIYNFTLKAQSDDELPLLINDWLKPLLWIWLVKNTSLCKAEATLLVKFEEVGSVCSCVLLAGLWSEPVTASHMWVSFWQNGMRTGSFLPFLMWWKSDNVLLKMSVFQTRREAKQIYSMTGFKRGAHIKVHKSMSALMNLTSTKLLWPFHPFKQTFTWRQGTLKNPGAICMSLPITLALAWSPLWTE